MTYERSRSLLQRRGLTRRRVLSGITAAGAGLLGAAVVGCGQQAGTAPAAQPAGGHAAGGSTPQQGGTFNTYHNMNLPLDPQKIDGQPHIAVDGVYSRILRWQTGASPKTLEDHNVENDLAVSVEAPDAGTWTIKLRPGVKFQNIPPVNGHALEAADVKATFVRSLDPAIGNPNRSTLSMIDPSQIQTPNATTVVFKLAFPYGPFSRVLASSVLGPILPREAQAGLYDPIKQVIGTGPFQLDNVTPDVAYTYKRSSGWFDKGPNVDEVKMAIIADAATQQAQFAAGNLDELNISDAFQLDAVKRQSPKATIFESYPTGDNPLYFQMGDPASPFQDVRVRRAFSMAIDRDAITKSVYNGQADQAVYVPGYMGKWCMWARDLPPDIQQYYKYNPADAKKLLEAAGATNLQLTLGDFGPTTPTYSKVLQAIGNNLNAIGIKTTLTLIDYNKDFIDSGHGYRQGYFPKDFVGFFHQAGYEDPDFWLFTYFHSKSGGNQERLNDPKYDALVDKQRGIVNDDERLKAVRDILTYLADQMYVPNAPSGPTWTAVQPRVRNYQWDNSYGIFTETYAKLWLTS